MYRQKSKRTKIWLIKKFILHGFVPAVVVIMLFGGTANVRAGSIMSSVVESQQPADNVPAKDEAGEQTVKDPNDPNAAPKAEQVRLDLEMSKDFGIRDALAMLASNYKKNIVPTPSVNGQLAFTSLRDVTFEEAMAAILGENFKYQQEGNLIKVYSKEEYKKLKEEPERKVYKIFNLYYITADEAAKLISPVLGESAKIEKSTPAEKSISGAAGSTAGGTSGTGGTSGSGGGNNMALHDIIVLYDYPENIAKAEELIRNLDVRPKQVLVEATILSVLLTEGMELGVDLNFMGGFSLNGTSATQDIVSVGTISRGSSASSPIDEIDSVTYGAPAETFGFATAGGKGLRIGVRANDARAFITALESVTDTTILANPKILAVNKQEGRVQIGKTIGYRGSTTIGQGGVASQGEVQFMDTGTVLVFRPFIGNDGYIRMDIYPQESTAELNVDKVPDKTTAEIKTNILLKDGETIVIGGLFKDSVTTTRNQIPILGDIPIIGYLFRGTVDKNQRQEVIVLLTPHIIEEPSDTQGQARADDIRRKRAGAKDALLDIDRAKIAEESYAKAVKCYMDGDIATALKELSVALALRPTYLEALRLKEKILSETDPKEFRRLESILNETMDQQSASKWMRR